MLLVLGTRCEPAMGCEHIFELHELKSVVYRLIFLFVQRLTQTYEMEL